MGIELFQSQKCTKRHGFSFFSLPVPPEFCSLMLKYYLHPSAPNLIFFSKLDLHS